MTLTLTVLRAPDAAPSAPCRIEGGEFSIGRGTDNDLVLADPDRHLSKRHCLLALRAGTWQVTDLSANGTYHNQDKTPLGQSATRDLADGDRLRLGPYEFGIGLRTVRPAPENPFAQEAAAPAAVRTPPRPAGGEDALLAAFREGAGLPAMATADPAAALRALGRATRAMVAGLRAALAARSAIKGTFRIDQTMLRMRGSNPLKFSGDDSEVLTALFGAPAPGGMEPAAAISEALEDIRLHEVASVAAMQAMIGRLLEQFDPSRIRTRAEENGGLAMLPAQRKARAWEAFELMHEETRRALAEDFAGVFGKSFARAYEKAVRAARERPASGGG